MSNLSTNLQMRNAHVGIGYAPLPHLQIGTNLGYLDALLRLKRRTPRAR